MMTSVPESVAIVAMGSSFRTYAQMVVNAGNRKRIAQETWAINSACAAFHHDRVFLMDDIEADLRVKARERPGTMVAGLLEWLASHPGPVYTSVPYDTIPGSVEYPLEAVLNSIQVPYLNTTVAYTVAFAIHSGVRHIGLYGCDFTYPDKHIAESGRACVEHLLGLAATRGIHITLPDETTLFDANVSPELKYYGYRFVGGVHLTRDESGHVRVRFGKDIQNEGQTQETDGGTSGGLSGRSDRGPAGRNGTPDDSKQGSRIDGAEPALARRATGDSDGRAFRGTSSEKVQAEEEQQESERRQWLVDKDQSAMR